MIWAAILIPSVLSATATIVAAIFGRRIYYEVRTGNGLPLGALAERQEGRRIEAETEPSERTDHEQRYVDQLNDPDVNPGQGLPPSH